MADSVGVLIVGTAGIVVEVVDGGGIGVFVGCMVEVLVIELLMVGVLVIEVLVEVVVGILVEYVLEVVGVEVDD